MTKVQEGFLKFVRTVIDAIEAAEVEYLIGGAVGLWAWGETLTTNDFDLVVNLPLEQIYRLSKELERRNMLVPPDVIVELLIQPEGDLPINAIQLNSNYKAELFLLRPGDVFRENALARRRLADLGPTIGQVYVHAPEDLILNKIHYFAISSQTKHIRDVASILIVSGSLIDFSYITDWCGLLGLTATWQEMQEDIDQLLRGHEREN